MRKRWLLIAALLGVLLSCAGGEGGETGDPGGDLQADGVPVPGEDALSEQDFTTDAPLSTDTPDVEPEVVEPLEDPGLRLREAGWLRGDLHMHTQHSDGDDPTAIVVALAEYLADEEFLFFHPEYEGNHLDFIAITDHRTLAIAEDPDFVSDQLILINGEEIGGPGHANAWGITEVVSHDPDGDGSTLEDYQAAVDNVHAQGGCFSMNHPYEPSINFGWDIRDHDGVEVWNAAWSLFSPEYDKEHLAEWEAAHGPASPLFAKGLEVVGSGGSAQSLRFYEAHLARGVHVAMVGGSDRHVLMPVGFPTTYVHAESADLEGFVQAVRGRHTFVSRTPVAATIEMTVTAASQTWEMGDAIAIPADGTVATVSVRVGRAEGGLLRLVLGHHVATDDELADATLGKPVLEVPIDSADAEFETVVTVQPGDWLYPMVLEPVIAPGLPTELAALVPEMALNASKAGPEDFDSVLNTFLPVLDLSQVLAPEDCDPTQWEATMLQCMPPDVNGLATFFVPDWVNRVLNVVSEANEVTDWCVGALGSAVLFVTAS